MQDCLLGRVGSPFRFVKEMLLYTTSFGVVDKQWLRLPAITTTQAQQQNYAMCAISGDKHLHDNKLSYSIVLKTML